MVEAVFRGSGSRPGGFRFRLGNIKPKEDSKQQQQRSPSSDNSTRNSNTIQQKIKTPPTYKDVIIKRDGLLLTDSNGKPISARRINHPGGVQRHTVAH